MTKMSNRKESTEPAYDIGRPTWQTAPVDLKKTLKNKDNGMNIEKCNNL